MCLQHLSVTAPMQLEYEELLAEQSAAALLAVLRRLDKERVASSLRLPPGLLCSLPGGRWQSIVAAAHFATNLADVVLALVLATTAGPNLLACSSPVSR